MDQLNHIIEQFRLAAVVRAFLFIILGIIVGKLISASLSKTLNKRMTPHQVMLIRRIVFYAVFLLFFASAIQEMGFKISALLGATGILTVALGIASQTSMSNLISGVFIIGEKPFVMGDTIKVNDIQGQVLSIDFLSVKIRTNDNTMIRIPNETLIKSAITNLSFFPIRRLSLLIGVAYNENIDRVKKILLETAAKNTLCLDEPKPTITLDGFGDSAINMQLCAWSQRDDYNALKDSLQEEIKNIFAANGIVMPYPCRSLYLGNSTDVLPVKIIHSTD